MLSHIVLIPQPGLSYSLLTDEGARQFDSTKTVTNEDTNNIRLRKARSAQQFIQVEAASRLGLIQALARYSRMKGDMNIREGGMPNQEMWESFFSPSTILQKMGLNGDCRKVVDFGCGYGTFSIPAAKITKGIVYAVDIDDGFIAECSRKVEAADLNSVICEQRDFVLNGVNLADNTVDYAMLFNILHAENPVRILQEAYRVLLPLGKVGVIHWNYDPTTPRGPSMNIRPRPEQCQEWIKAAGFELVEPLINLPPCHYGIVGQKPEI